MLTEDPINEIAPAGLKTAAHVANRLAPNHALATSLLIFALTSPPRPSSLSIALTSANSSNAASEKPGERASTVRCAVDICDAPERRPMYARRVSDDKARACGLEEKSVSRRNETCEVGLLSSIRLSVNLFQYETLVNISRCLPAIREASATSTAPIGATSPFSNGLFFCFFVLANSGALTSSSTSTHPASMGCARRPVPDAPESEVKEMASHAMSAVRLSRVKSKRGKRRRAKISWAASSVHPDPT